MTWGLCQCFEDIGACILRVSMLAKKKAMHQSVGEVPETDGRADFAVNPKSKPAVESV